MAETVGRWLYAAYRRIEPPGSPWWRLYAVILGPPVLIWAFIQGLHLAHVLALWSALIR